MASVLRPFWKSKTFSDVLLVIEAAEAYCQETCQEGERATKRRKETAGQSALTSSTSSSSASFNTGASFSTGASGSGASGSGASSSGASDSGASGVDTLNSNAAYSVTLHCSRIILAAHSPYFKTILEGAHGMMESGQKIVSIRVKTPEEVDALYVALKILYYQTCDPKELDESADINSLAVLQCADRFQLDRVVSAVATSITEVLEADHDLAGVTAVLDLPESVQTSNNDAVKHLIQEAKKQVSIEFRDLTTQWTSEAWLKLSLSALIAVVTDADLRVPSENTVFVAIDRWIRYSPHCLGDTDADTTTKRYQYLKSILGTDGALRLAGLRYPFLMFVARYKLPGGLPLGCSSLLQSEVSQTYLHQLHGAMIYRTCDDHTKKLLFGGSLEGSHSAFTTVRPGFKRVWTVDYLWDFILDNTSLPRAGLCIRSTTFTNDGYGFRLEAHRVASEVEGNQDTLMIALRAADDGELKQWENGGCLRVRVSARVYNYVTEEFESLADRNTNHIAVELDRDWAGDTKLYIGFALRHNDALRMGSHGWDDAVGSATGVVKNPFVGPRGVVMIECHVSQLPPPLSEKAVVDIS